METEGEATQRHTNPADQQTGYQSEIAYQNVRGRLLMNALIMSVVALFVVAQFQRDTLQLSAQQQRV
ncbi:hypothetical protein JQ629_35655 [Bradyrhizobium sp. AUGA SZCCT0222]|uniref:hypothetical protein n=1 Tax=Bradyrhizobium sp. AUGA SZCCT0222 TaxID=2807668 RepID=UPI001BABE7FA|nr:hypothetical protein [Bradyrhizobium sp. AUGA SZCCT0222]MBR1272823.1 hypothetical protein [Bradyrhizobium sp. AUGA SZCCT0222]